MNKNNLLRSVSLFYGLSDKELGYISSGMIAKTFKTGSFIFKENADGERCFFVAEGSVKVTRSSKDGKEVILSMLNKGDFFGEMALIDGKSRSANVIATEKTKVLTLNREDFLSVLHNYPKIAIQLLKEMANRLRESDSQIASLTLSDAEKRIALCILKLADEQGIIKNGEVKILKIPIQQDIASMSGTSRETVSRVLKLLEEENFIRRQGRELIIKSYKKFITEFNS
jgi:CRP/FNR family cyclic AMP-dependent transcriptional regulator